MKSIWFWAGLTAWNLVFMANGMWRGSPWWITGISGFAAGLCCAELVWNINKRRINDKHRRAAESNYQRARASAGTGFLVPPSLQNQILAYPYPYAGARIGTSVGALPVEESDGTPIVGHRYYTLVEGQEYLRGAADCPWPTRRLTAVCRNGEEDEFLDDISERHLRAGVCSCGIYMLQGPVMRQFPNQTKYVGSSGIYVSSGYMNPQKSVGVYADCVGWGTVLEGSLGYRVQHCRIEKLYVADDAEWAMPVLEKYGVPIEHLVVQTPEEAADLMRQHLAEKQEPEDVPSNAIEITAHGDDERTFIAPPEERTF